MGNDILDSYSVDVPVSQWPQRQEFVYDSWPGIEGATDMEFRLVYQGRLPAAGRSLTRNEDKHRIRKTLHPQLRELWKADPRLRRYLRDRESDRPDARLFIDIFADDYARCGYRFVPLIGGRGDEDACALDVLFLRRDQPGNLVSGGGDIDNRIKVLLDALRMPQECQEVAGQTPTSDEDPFYCLLKDDSLITKLTIETDHLLTPLTDGENIHDVHLIIGVKTISYGSYLRLHG
ncbi:MAG: hypothetical protein V7641_5041 [Blastocatellia bacterium]